MPVTLDKAADLAGPGIGDYRELEKILPRDYHSLLNPRETQQAIFAAKQYIAEHLTRQLNLMMVTVPLIVDAESGVNDYLDRDGSRTPSSSILPTTTTSILSTRRWSRQPPSGGASP